ncbi:hypothetical protein [Brevibacillus massiliensis]|uniref:hypothetical protein n=1 Tax=Brevibacillus massiliensis TaxID=1118054 RepID=UPI000360C271|nr:hypothetical protein [Brevibacillus massiliensis]
MEEDQSPRAKSSVGQRLVNIVLPWIISDLKQKGKWPPSPLAACRARRGAGTAGKREHADPATDTKRK